MPIQLLGHQTVSQVHAATDLLQFFQLRLGRLGPTCMWVCFVGTCWALGGRPSGRRKNGVVGRVVGGGRVFCSVLYLLSFNNQKAMKRKTCTLPSSTKKNKKNIQNTEFDQKTQEKKHLQLAIRHETKNNKNAFDKKGLRLKNPRRIKYNQKRVSSRRPTKKKRPTCFPFSCFLAGPASTKAASSKAVEASSGPLEGDKWCSNNMRSIQNSSICSHAT